jgi:hypothetical protein
MLLKVFSLRDRLRMVSPINLNAFMDLFCLYVRARFTNRAESAPLLQPWILYCGGISIMTQHSSFGKFYTVLTDTKGVKYVITRKFAHLANIFLKLIQTDSTNVMITSVGRGFFYVDIRVYWKELNAVV